MDGDEIKDLIAIGRNKTGEFLLILSDLEAPDNLEIGIVPYKTIAEARKNEIRLVNKRPEWSS